MKLGDYRRAARAVAAVFGAVFIAGCATVATDDRAPIAAADYVAGDAVIENPERGFYGWAEPITTTGPQTDFQKIRERGLALAFAYLLLDDDRQGPLSPAYLARLEETFEAARAAGVKLIVRPAYDYPGRTDPDAAPVTLARAEEHLEQLKPVFAAHGDMLVAVQAGIIGPWGEWHSASPALSTPDARRRLVDALMAAVPPDRFIQLRTPAFMMEQAPEPVSWDARYSAERSARIAHHNDCFLASEDDLGTYFPPDRADAYRTYLAAASRYGPVGGETCQADLPTQRSDCTTALAEMARFHWTFLNADYDQAVIEEWRRGGCFGEIDRKLGYRIGLTSARLYHGDSRAGPYELELDLRNEGWAAVHGPRSAILTLVPEGREAAPDARDAARQTAMRLQLGTKDAPCMTCPTPIQPDARHWLPAAGEASRLRFRLTGDALAMALGRQARPAGDEGAVPMARYRLFLSLPDPSPRLTDRPEYAIQLANAEIWDPATGQHDLGLVLALDARPSS